MLCTEGRGVGSLGAGVTGSCGLWFWDSNTGPLEEQ